MVEHYLDTVGVGGSKPLAPTRKAGGITDVSTIAGYGFSAALANRVANRASASSGIACEMSGKGAYSRSASVCAPRVVAVDHVARGLMPRALTDPSVRLARPSRPSAERGSQVMEAERLNVWRVLLEK